MFDVDGFAIAAIPAGFGDDPIPDGSHRCSSLRSKVDTGMGQVGAENGMKSRLGKMGGDGAKFQRETEKRARQASALLIIITAHALLPLKVDRGVFLSGATEFSR